MDIHIISVGKLSKYFQPIAMEYQKMIRWKIKSTELHYQKKLPSSQIKQFEAKLITEHIKTRSFKIILEVNGKNLTSHGFAELISTNLLNGIDFVIGGAFGLDASLLENANFKLSLSTMTMPHQMAKIILIEQIYRAQTILTNHPYHK